ncbi:hypothetical protein EMVG_00050 [Emiliania huxleyi virus PS401]|nr:hypothetical protein EMVG_00050 [Emiliania huxleyi virus PS401]
MSFCVQSSAPDSLRDSVALVVLPPHRALMVAATASRQPSAWTMARIWAWVMSARSVNVGSPDQGEPTPGRRIAPRCAERDTPFPCATSQARARVDPKGRGDRAAAAIGAPV